MRQALTLMLYLLLAARAITTAAGHDCKFIPGPITASNDTAVVKMDCYTHDVGLGDATGNSTHLVVYLYNCTVVPVRLFVDISDKLSAVTLVSEKSEELPDGTFEGLGNIAELRLEGFRNLRSLGSAVFRPLRSLERLLLVGFGANRLTYAELGAALYELSGTPLQRIVMHEIHSEVNGKLLNLTALIQMRNVSVREATFSGNYVRRISGRLSRVLPNLNYLCIGLNVRHYEAINTLFDAWMFLSNLNELVLYAYPVPYQRNTDLPDTPKLSYFRDLHLEIKSAISKHLGHLNCHWTLKFPFTPSLRRLTVRNIQLWKLAVDKPMCFDNSNNIEYLSFAGCPLPVKSTQFLDLDQLKYLDIQNTGIVALPDGFFSYFPKLETTNLVQLAIGESMKHINSSFFGNCPTLREIHLGDCQLTFIPSSTFVLLPALKILNVSSNSLQTFDVSLINSSNLSRLNLSGNAISTLSENVLVELNAIAQLRLQAGEILTVDLRRNPSLTCLCNSTYFVRQLQDWVMKQQANVPGFEYYVCLHPNGSRVAMSQVDVDQSEKQCEVLREFKNGSDCPCDDDLRERLEVVRLSLHGYVCRTYDGELMSMTVQPLPSCPDFFRSATFIALVVVGSVVALSLTVIIIVLYRHRKTERVQRIIEQLGMNRIVRLGIQHAMAQNREDPSSFEHEVFLYIQADEPPAVQRWFDKELSPNRSVLGQDDRHGLKVETIEKGIQTCRWLVPVLSPNFVDDGECCYFIDHAFYSRPHAFVPVVWTDFNTDNVTINELLENSNQLGGPETRRQTTIKRRSGRRYWKEPIASSTAFPLIRLCAV